MDAESQGTEVLAMNDLFFLGIGFLMAVPLSDWATATRGCCLVD